MDIKNIPDKKIVIAKYKRCSTMLQVETSLIAQDEILEREIENIKEEGKTYEVLDFEDDAVSGKTTDRPQLKKMLEYVHNKKIDIIMFTKLDRLGRSLQDLLNLVTDFENNNVKFKCISPNIDTLTPTGKLMFQIFGAFAEFERTMIRERLESGRERAKIKGTKSGKSMNRPKLEDGEIRKNGKTKKIDVDGIVMKFRNGMSMNQIAKYYEVSITPIRRILIERGEWNTSARNINPHLKKQFN